MSKEYLEPEMIEIRHIQKEQSFILEMVHIEAKGKNFKMGSDNGRKNEKPVHKVSFNYDFELGKTAVTIEQYMYFVNDTNSNHPEWLEEGSKYNIKTGTNDLYKNINTHKNAPVVGVSWNDAQAYCKWLSKKTNKEYRLPTEAEWEYACRAETTTEYSFGDDASELGDYAWYRDNSNGQTHLVGEKKPNPWGLYDMHGNVWEWCEDSWVDNYNNTPRDGSAYKDTNTNSKIHRGGSWYNIDSFARSSSRYYWFVGYRYDLVGFRLLRTLP